ncbi:collectin-10 isoform X2 [Esox lucius]|uniref:collectin-10 isoform X2 n=1 Tax=Esox lucius TaxID=8010 RepID=UPI00057718AE|nr:collectin-10 isoform X2 [Esox lucius]
MDYQNLSRRLLLLFVLSTISNSLDAVDVCSNTILPGSKGDPGERGDEGDQGRQGKTGPPGLIGLTGELGSKGDVGRTGKTGPAGEKGDQGAAGLAGPSGLKGKTGTTCDCGRYRKLVGQLDNTVSKLKNAVKFVKNGIKETEERLYLIVKEARRYREALANCKLRGGSLAMPKTADTNTLIRDYVAQSALTRVFIGVQRGEKEGGAVYADHTPVRNYTGWGLGEPPGASTNTSCVEMAGTGVWNQVECDVPLYYVCEFKRTRRGGLPSVL